MAYVASLLKIIPHLQHPNARVAVVTREDEYASMLFNNLKTRAEEGVEPWASATFKFGTRVEMANGAWLTIFGVPFDEEDGDKWGLCGMQCTYAFISRTVDDALSTFIKTRCRGAEYPGPIGWDVLEEWRDNPFR